MLDWFRALLPKNDKFFGLFVQHAALVLAGAESLSEAVKGCGDQRLQTRALGTLLGGWRIVHTMRSKITRLTPIQGFCAETGGAITLFGATFLGTPVSTTPTITGAIVGVGAARRTTAVRGGIAQDIVVAWVVTIPARRSLRLCFAGWRFSSEDEFESSVPASDRSD